MKKPSIWPKAFLVGGGFGVFVTVVTGNTTTLDFVSSILIYTVLCALVIEIWRKPWGRKLLVGVAVLVVIGIILTALSESSKSTSALLPTVTVAPVVEPTRWLYPTAIPRTITAVPSAPALTTPNPEVVRALHLALGCPGGCEEHLPDCDIKGNVSFDSGEKIYQVPGQLYYDQTEIDPDYGERWFCTEDEVIAAGWRKAKE